MVVICKQYTVSLVRTNCVVVSRIFFLINTKINRKQWQSRHVGQSRALGIRLSVGCPSVSLPNLAQKASYQITSDNPPPMSSGMTTSLLNSPKSLSESNKARDGIEGNESEDTELATSKHRSSSVSTPTNLSGEFRSLFIGPYIVHSRCESRLCLSRLKVSMRRVPHV